MSSRSADTSLLKELNAIASGEMADESVPGIGLALAKDLAGLCVNSAGRTLTPYLLLGNWDANPLAAQLEEEFPETAKQRYAIPDPLYKGREAQAPCLVPMPQALRLGPDVESLSQAFARDWLAHWLQAAWQEVQARLARQHFCGVLLSGQSIDLVAKHLARLGFQYPPVAAGQSANSARLFRYQDPRVMQRVWPRLRAPQQRRWLGAVQAWWTLTQPWEPWAPQDSAADCTMLPAQWFKAEWPMLAQEPTQVPLLNRLMNLEQWQAAHSAPVGNQAWAALASAKVPVAQQPEGAAMSAAIARGQRLGLEGQDLEAFTELSWLLPGEERAIQAHARRWDEPLTRQALEQALQQMRSQPDLHFAGAWLNVKPN